MKVLAFDTAMGALSAAIWVDGKITGSRHQLLTRGHAEKLMPMITEVCLEARLEVSDCDRIGVTVGPGTFTGQRVGLAAARAMRLGTDLDLVGITTLKALAAGVEDADQTEVIASVIDARRGEVYLQTFTPALDALSQPAVLSPSAAVDQLMTASGPLLLVGSGAELVVSLLAQNHAAFKVSSAAGQPDACHVARLASEVEGDVTHVPSPLYLRAPDAKLPQAR